MFSIAQYLIVFFFIKIVYLLLKLVVNIFIPVTSTVLPHLLRENKRDHINIHKWRNFEIRRLLKQTKTLSRLSEIWLTDQKKNLSY